MSRPAFLKAPSLFWRTFILLMLLIVICVMGWLQSFRALNELHYAQGTAQQIVSMANLTRYALISADPDYRTDLLMALARREGLRILPLEPDDRASPVIDGLGYAHAPMAEVERIVREQLGPDTILASELNGAPGLWVSISIEGDRYWLLTNSALINPSYGSSWLWWALAAMVGSVLGTTWLTQRLVAPLRRLSLSARRFGEGRSPARLPEDTGPRELREVNSSFNRMVRDITSMEEDREVLLAGVSHDLRTPITRLLLELEMADLPQETRDAMTTDLGQMELIVNQFADYAKKSSLPLERVDLSDTVARYLKTARVDTDPAVRLEKVDIAPGLHVSAHPLELYRVIQNVISNAQRYGRGEDGLTRLTVLARQDRERAVVEVSDRGPGISAAERARVMRPFERGDAARSGAHGSGLGLAIVDRVIRRCGGDVELLPNQPSGLTVRLSLPLAQERQKG